MYIRLAEHIALRSWKELTYAYYTKTSPYAEPVTKKQAELLLQCDGEHDIALDKTVMELAARGMITACEKGDHPSEWSAYKAYDNRYFPRMNLMLTGKCNYNCLHCFNAADNAPLMTEWSYEELCKLLDQAEECGIHAFTLTGGEPMVHKRFMDILHEIRRRNMLVEELNTNGYYITPDILDEMKEMDCVPLIKISFDGIGYHDWMRNHKGAEKRTLEVMRLCREKGFRVVAQTNVNRRNVGSMAETAGVLDRIGVETMRWSSGSICSWIRQGRISALYRSHTRRASVKIVMRSAEGREGWWRSPPRERWFPVCRHRDTCRWSVYPTEICIETD